MQKDWLENQLRDRFEDWNPDLDLSDQWEQLENQRRKRKRRLGMIFLPGILFIGTLVWLLAPKGNEASMNPSTSNYTAQAFEDKLNNEDRENTILKGIELSSTNEDWQAADNKSGGLDAETKSSDERPIQENLLVSVRPIQKADILKETVAILNTPEKDQNSTQKALITSSNSVIGNVNFESGMSPMAFLPVEIAYLIIKEPNTVLPEIQIVEKSTAPAIVQNRWQVEADVAYGLLKRKLSAENVEMEDYVQKLKNDESEVDAFAVTLFLNRKIAPGFTIKLGLEYEQAYIKLNTSWDTSVMKIIRNQVVEIREWAPDSIQEIYGDILAMETLHQSGKYWQQYRTFGIPIEFQVQKPISTSGLYLNASVGMTLGLSQNTKGKTLDPRSQAPTDLSLTEIRTSGLVSWRSAIGLNKQLGDTWGLSAGLSWKYDLNNRYKDSVGINSRFYRWQLMIGITANLN